MVYSWKQERFNADAQKVGRELEAVENKTASEVVEFAKEKPESELHKCFEWDDTKAGHEYRLEQARLVMRMIVVTFDDPVVQDKTITIRAFEPVVKDGEIEKIYIDTRQVLNNEELAKNVFERLQSSLQSAIKTIDIYGYLSPIFSSIKDDISSAIKKIP